MKHKPLCKICKSYLPYLEFNDYSVRKQSMPLFKVYDKQYFNMNVLELCTKLNFCWLFIKPTNIEKILGYINTIVGNPREILIE